MGLPEFFWNINLTFSFNEGKILSNDEQVKSLRDKFRLIIPRRKKVNKGAGICGNLPVFRVTCRPFYSYKLFWPLCSGNTENINYLI